MGRYIRITNGSKIQSYPIVGRELDSETAVTDKDAILARNPKRSNENIAISDSKLTIPWQAEIVGQAPAVGPQNIVIAIIRSPLTGVVHTYSKLAVNDVAMPLIDNSLLVSANESSDRAMCLDAGVPLTGGTLGVVIKKYASSQSFVQTAADGTGVCA
jgi:hypothetical protein